ncbi:hypothetical protein [Robertmurraya siralis]|uniref:hypothetical protein n=1 Tax=Robertmurraya siralis TaxID=77777 RepID=UPI0010F503AB|nr:hypothetical protein [Robertmurraya siralis]
MDIKIKLKMHRVYHLRNATHILATKNYGSIHKDDIVEVHNYCGMDYVCDIGAELENEILNEIDDNILLEITYGVV